jgi:hypothetical protein
MWDVIIFDSGELEQLKDLLAEEGFHILSGTDPAGTLVEMRAASGNEVLVIGEVDGLSPRQVLDAVTEEGGGWRRAFIVSNATDLDGVAGVTCVGLMPAVDLCRLVIAAVRVERA